MKICPNCGNQIMDNAEYCHYCLILQPKDDFITKYIASVYEFIKVLKFLISILTLPFFFIEYFYRKLKKYIKRHNNH